MKTLSHQDLTDLVEGAAIFSSGGGGDPVVGFNIVDGLIEKRCRTRLIEPAEVPDDEIVADFACVGATANVGYHGDAALKALRKFEESLKKKIFAILPTELGGFSTLAAVDVASRHGIPVVDADGAGRAVPEIHLQAHSIDTKKLSPVVVTDVDAQHMVVKKVNDSKAIEQMARTLAAETNQTVYVVRPVLAGRQVKTSPVLNTVSSSIRIGVLLRKAVDPLRAVLRETNGFLLFEGVVSSVERKTRDGFTWTNLKMDDIRRDPGLKLELKAKNSFLIAHKDGKPVAIAPDIITTVNPEDCKCMPAEKIIEDNKLAVLGIPASPKLRSQKGLKLWRESMQRSGINEKYVPVEQLAAKNPR